MQPYAAPWREVKRSEMGARVHSQESHQLSALVSSSVGNRQAVLDGQRSLESDEAEISRALTEPTLLRFEVFTAVTMKNGMLRRVALVITDVSEELTASFIRVTRIGELGTTLALTSNRVGDLYVVTELYQYNCHNSGHYRLFFYLKHTVDNIRTSQETHYVSATSPTGKCDV
jgi:hypothetical protein